MAELKTSLGKDIDALRALVVEGGKLLENPPISDNSESAWKLKARYCLKRIFGADSPYVSDVVEAGNGGDIFIGMTEGDFEKSRTEAFSSKLANLNAIIEMLENDDILQRDNTQFIKDRSYGSEVFLVHGHDHAALHLVARFLDKIGHSPTILQEESNNGRTVIEKFEDHSDVGFAVVLLTPDDKGGKKESDFESLNFRARQNVIFELGYFVGKITRKRVCALYAPSVEILSDYEGVLNIHLDQSGGWKLQLAREMKAAGLEIDMNLAT